MKWIIRAVVFSLLIGAGSWLWLYFHPSPEAAIRRQLAQLAEAASFKGPEGMIAGVAAASKFAGFFGREVRMNIEPRGFFEEETTRQDIAQFVTAARTRAGIRSLAVKIFDPVITLGANNDSAIVELTVNVETAGERHLIVQELKFTMKLVDKEWLIVQVDTVKTLNQAPRQVPRNTPAPA
jgi:hypothetical protein